jgi:hypothetical protein
MNLRVYFGLSITFLLPFDRHFISHGKRGIPLKDKIVSCLINYYVLSTYHQRLTPSLAPKQLWPQAYFGSRHISARGILRPQKYFGPEILQFETTSNHTLA